MATTIKDERRRGRMPTKFGDRYQDDDRVLSEWVQHDGFNCRVSHFDGQHLMANVMLESGTSEHRMDISNGAIECTCCIADNIADLDSEHWTAFQAALSLARLQYEPERRRKLEELRRKELSPHRVSKNMHNPYSGSF